MEAQKKGEAPLLVVRVIRSTAEPNRFWWLVRELEGEIIESSPRNYSSEAEARHAAEVAARAVGRRKSLKS
jgi:hypothetical protein